MFECEAAFQKERTKFGQRQAVEYIADINRWTHLKSPRQSRGKDDAESSLGWRRTLFDHNEHFIEMSNMGEEGRSLKLMLLLLFFMAFLVPLYGALAITVAIGVKPVALASFIAPIAGLVILYFIWPHVFSSSFFTTLRARYRFNRTTGKVYALRPKKFGGNAVLDWERVQAHVSWCAPHEMTYDDLRDPVARRSRQEFGGGPFDTRGLLLYWPPLDPDDRERKGEDVLWVGPKLAGDALWQYIRTFMEEGIDKVPAPNEFEWLRKGFHSPSEHIEETELAPSRVMDRLGGRGENSVQTQATFLATALWAPLHSLAERLCSWPTFPEEWNSDCGQKRREDGIGAEEPTRWLAR